MQTTRLLRSPIVALLIACAASSGCNLSVDDKAKDAKDAVDDALPDDFPDLSDVDLDVKVCGDQTLSDLLKADGLSNDCRAKVESFLPEAQSSFESRLVVLGDVRENSGERTVYVVGADAEGGALFAGAPTDIQVSVKLDGKLRVLQEGEFTVELPEDGDLLSLSVVNDYSASMREDDLDVVSEIESDLFTYLPPVYEAEVTQFSTMVHVKQAFSEDSEALLAAVAPDEQYTRESTALLDAMGTALTSLAARERPLKVLLVSTDGAENASMTYDQAQVLAAIEQSDTVVIMLGALFADVNTLKTLSGDRGIYFYTRGYGRLKSAVQGLIESLGELAAVHLPAGVADAEEVRLQVAGQEVTLRP